MKKLILTLLACAVATPVSAQVATVGQYEQTMDVCRRTARAFDAMGAHEATALMRVWLKKVDARYAVEETTGSAMCLAYIAGVADGRKQRIGQQLATEKKK